MADPTTGDLIKDKLLTIDSVDAAVDAFLMGVGGQFFRLAESYELNLRAAVDASTWASETLAKPDATELQKRAAVKTAILLAVPTKL